MLTFVNISPAVYNLGETVCSLNFASRCRSTELGQAKKQTGSGPSEQATPGAHGKLLARDKKVSQSTTNLAGMYDNSDNMSTGSPSLTSVTSFKRK